MCHHLTAARSKAAVGSSGEGWRYARVERHQRHLLVTYKRTPGQCPCPEARSSFPHLWLPTLCKPYMLHSS